MSTEPPRNEPQFRYSDLLPTGPDAEPTRRTVWSRPRASPPFEADGQTFLRVDPEALQRLTAEAMHDIAHYLRPGHLAQLRKILDDPEASANDRFVALDLLKNANIAAGGVLPMCQDTGTAIVMGKKGEGVLTGGDDGEADQPRRLRRLHEAEPALLPDRAAHDVRREEHRHQPAGADRDLLDPATASRVQVPLHGQGRRLGEQVLPLPGDQGAPQPGADAARSSTRRSARSAPPRARRTTSPSSSAARAPSSR